MGDTFMPQRYIGVTDFATAEQILIARALLDRHNFKGLLAVGLMMNLKTLTGQKSRWSKVFPPKETLYKIFVYAPGVLNVLHYADYEGRTTSRIILEALSWAGPNVQAIQFDMVWPDSELLKAVKVDFPRLKFIVQVGGDAMRQVDGKLELAAEKLLLYKAGDCLDYVLLDRSGGTGEPMDSKLLLTWARRLTEFFPSLGMVVAGGLGPKTMSLIDPIINEFPDVSWDAQRQLHENSDSFAPLDMSRVVEFLELSVRASRKVHIP